MLVRADVGQRGDIIWAGVTPPVISYPPAQCSQYQVSTVHSVYSVKRHKKVIYKR